MILSLEGKQTIDLPREKVFDLLTNTNFIGSALPDAEEVKVIDSENIEARLKVRVSIVSVTMNVKLKVGERERPNYGTLYVNASGSGSNVKIVSRFDLTNDKPTNMTWKAQVEVTGVISGLGSGVLKSFADKKVSEIFGSLTKAMQNYS